MRVSCLVSCNKHVCEATEHDTWILLEMHALLEFDHHFTISEFFFLLLLLLPSSFYVESSVSIPLASFFNT